MTADPHGPRIVKTFHEALDILDQSEPTVRDLIETNLMDVAGINRTKVSDAMLTRDELSKRIITLRHHHIKSAFRHLRDSLPSDSDLPEPAMASSEPPMSEPKDGPPKIHGHSFAAWAQNIAAQDAHRIHTTISVGLTAGESNTDIAHRVIGSRRLNGSNGVTEITRQHILRLGKGLLHKRKARMAGQ